ncbi:MAG: hypothetical protein HWE27_13775 [Gammaproteobacteria bacterium]|nr:hypothetical protein [Gammaproteobacteria bacterium]
MRALTIIFVLCFYSVLSYSRDGFNGASLERTQSNGHYDAKGWSVNYLARQSLMTVYAGYQWLRLDPVTPDPLIDERINLSGFQAGMLIHPDFEVVRPYLGVGTFFGEDRQCSSSEANCVNNGVFAIYPEAGIEFDLGSAVSITAKARWYEFNDQAYQDERLLSISIAYFID